MMISLVHLGSPERAFRAVANLRTSWLSREILFACLFTALLLSQTLLALTGGERSLSLALIVLTALTVLALFTSMSRVYLLRTSWEWNTSLTIASFLLSCLTLGLPVAYLLLLVERRGELADILIPLSLLALVVRGGLLVWRSIRGRGREWQGGLREFRSDANAGEAGEVVLYFLGAAVLCVCWLAGPQAPMLSLVFVIGLVCVFAGECIDRAGFYRRGLGVEA